ncbi:hypothetical protein ACL2XP_24115 [Sodalis sp. RH21]|uniref:hypothetical protein n=1 Tax=unclassified Sodalis (in: enterobacteria) TaxID=2636512 RepID=UPI0039B5A502
MADEGDNLSFDPAPAIPVVNSPPVLFQHVRIFDGKGDSLSGPANVLVTGNTTTHISTGLIDAHWHAFMAATPKMVPMTAQSSYLQLLALSGFINPYPGKVNHMPPAPRANEKSPDVEVRAFRVLRF